MAIISNLSSVEDSQKSKLCLVHSDKVKSVNVHFVEGLVSVHVE